MSLENIGNIHTDLIPLSVLQDVDKEFLIGLQWVAKRMIRIYKDR